MNVTKVLELDQRRGGNAVSGRALEALLGLLNVLGISLVPLVPSVPRGVLTAVLLVMAFTGSVSPTRTFLSARRTPHTRRSLGFLSGQLSAVWLTSLFYLLGGVTLAATAGGGLYWLPAAFVLAVFGAGVNAWIMLVEIPH